MMARNDTLKMGKLRDIAFYILLSLVKENHRYSIMKTVEEVTGGEIKIGAASLYSTLKKLVNEEMIEKILDQSFNKKTYIITSNGYETLKKIMNEEK
ncbi:PadR family transcriptional regulator [Oceanobacillus bengalensis]|uniref:PadR family transcriptional regulator n=1 Tax=Oceanobacillus bengalensis TaxID=1435466 RepID=UPI001FE5D676|nr:PadR family transcriptional regulator [Oceanobacillus bengalensis]